MITELQSHRAAFHPLTSILHWIVVVLLCWLVWSGLYADEVESWLGGWVRDQHRAFGIAVFVLALVRISLRVLFKAPVGEGGWRGQLASWVQRGLYGVMLIYPVTGYLYHSAFYFRVPYRAPVDLWGIVDVPNIPVSAQVFGLMKSKDFWLIVHQACLYVLAGLLTLHIAGALFHTFILRDGTMAKILPFRRKI